MHVSHAGQKLKPSENVFPWRIKSCLFHLMEEAGAKSASAHSPTLICVDMALTRSKREAKKGITKTCVDKIRIAFLSCVNAMFLALKLILDGFCSVL